MDELTGAQENRLAEDVQKGQIIRSFCQHPGFKLYKERIEEELADKKNAWLKGSDEDARTERIRAQGIQKALDILKQFILLGENSARVLNQNASLIDEK